jgi:hypothetical protein
VEKSNGAGGSAGVSSVWNKNESSSGTLCEGTIGSVGAGDSPDLAGIGGESGGVSSAWNAGSDSSILAGNSERAGAGIAGRVALDSSDEIAQGSGGEVGGVARFVFVTSRGATSAARAGAVDGIGLASVVYGVALGCGCARTNEIALQSGHRTFLPSNSAPN